MVLISASSPQQFEHTLVLQINKMKKQLRSKRAYSMYIWRILWCDSIQHLPLLPLSLDNSDPGYHLHISSNVRIYNMIQINYKKGLDYRNSH